MVDLQTRLRDATLDRYEIECELGRGGMATVFRARDIKHDRSVAIKVLHPELAVAATSERFDREISIAARLNHPNALSVIDSGFHSGLQYYVMPFVDGESLRERLDREGPLPINQALDITRQAAGALLAAHKSDLIHRDVKPGNILLADDHVYLADFGIARAADPVDRLTSTGFSVGTPMYMSPEQATASGSIDGRSDQYSLACVLYEMLAGHPPFLGATQQEIIARHALDPMPSVRSARPAVSPALEKTLRHALGKTPADRFKTLEEFIAALPTAADVATAELRASLPRWRRGLTRRSMLTAAAFVAVAAATGLAVRSWAPTGATGVSDRILLTVLPLTNEGPSEDDYFADGLSEEITARLTRVAGIGIIARNNSISREGEDRDVAQIGRELGVRYVLAGTLRWADAPEGRRVRVAPELHDIESGTVVWGEPYTATLSDVFLLQSELAERVVQALQVRLGEDERAAVRAASTDNIEAYTSYARGRFQWKKRTAAGMTLAIEEFQSAIEEDSTYARAYAGLADTYVLYNQHGGTDIPRDEALALAREAAETALRFDRNLAEARASLGEVVMYADWDWGAAEGHFQSAIGLDEDYATVRQWYSELLSVTGRQQEALLEGRAAARLDPTSAATTHAAALPLLGLYEFDRAIAEYERVLELDPAFAYALYGILWTHIASKNLDGALSHLERLGDTTTLTRSWIEAAIDPARRPAARAIVAEHADQVAAQPLLVQAIIHTAVGESDEAISILERAEAERDVNVFGIKNLPVFDELRNEPRFRDLIARLGFPPDRLIPRSPGA